jgi:peptidase E
LNILLDKLDFNEIWAYESLKNIIRPDFKICIIPFSFHEKWIKDKEEWETIYNNINGKEYIKIVSPFYTYGIKDDNIALVNYFTDSNESAIEKVNISDIVFFTGGFPEKIMKRLLEFNLISVIEQYKGIKMGWSAGAMMQCYDYYISPDDEDYLEFQYEKGLKYIEDFAVEVHYKNTEVQNKSIEKFVREKKKMVYTTERQSAIIVDNKKVTLLGNAKMYEIK